MVLGFGFWQSGAVLRMEEEYWPVIPASVTFCSALWQMCTHRQRHTHTHTHMHTRNTESICQMNQTNGPVVLLAPLTVLSLFYLDSVDIFPVWLRTVSPMKQRLTDNSVSGQSLFPGVLSSADGLHKSVRKSLPRLQRSETVKGHHNMAIKGVNVWGLFVFFHTLWVLGCMWSK